MQIKRSKAQVESNFLNKVDESITSIVQTNRNVFNNLNVKYLLTYTFYHTVKNLTTKQCVLRERDRNRNKMCRILPLRLKGPFI